MVKRPNFVYIKGILGALGLVIQSPHNWYITLPNPSIKRPMFIVIKLTFIGGLYVIVRQLYIREVCLSALFSFMHGRHAKCQYNLKMLCYCLVFTPILQSNRKVWPYIFILLYCLIMVVNSQHNFLNFALQTLFRPKLDLHCSLQKQSGGVAIV